MKIGNVVMFLCIAIALFPLTTDADTVKKDGYALFLEQSYPNPFNPRTSIEYEVMCPSDSCVDSVFTQLSIFNVLGTVVDTLVSKFQCINERYVVIWDGYDADGKRVPSGIYFYRLEIAGQNCTKKMMLLH